MAVDRSGASTVVRLVPDDLLRLRKAFWDGRSVDLGGVPEAITRSWARSRDYGVEPGMPLDADISSGQEMRVLHECNELLLRAASPVLQSLRQETQGSLTGLLLTDADGLLISLTGDHEFLDICSTLGGRVGICLHEAVRGTNAAGMALVDGSPVVVHGAQHYIERNSLFSCAAAPIRDPYGKLVGTLDLTTHRNLLHPHSLALVRLAVAAIERQMFLQLARGHTCIRFFPGGESAGIWGEGMLSIDGDGTIIGANEVAGQLIGLSAAKIRGQSFESVFDCELERYLDLARSGRAAPLATCRGQLLNAVLEFDAEPVRRGATVVVGSRSGRPLDELDTGDPVMSATIGRLRRVNGRGVNLLILGETGTGKEMLARGCHEEGDRRRGNFVAINCAALPEGLIESELFGYSEGAFTGARRKGYPGKVLEADRGTLFLDEIGDMPLLLQARLLRVLQERTVTPLGGGRPVPVDFALICATHQNLDLLVSAGRFREDLYYRIKGLVLKLPPLRTRSDMAALVSRLLAGERGRTTTVAPAVLDLFQRYGWPGNVRQLHSILRAAALFMDERDVELRMDHLPDDFLDLVRCAETSVLEADLDTLSRHAVQRVVDACRGNISAAARQLKVSRNTVYRKLGNAT